MIKLRFHSEEYKPKYMTEYSAACDLTARESQTIEPGGRVKIATGVWIEDVQWDEIPRGLIPEIQIRARSGLAFKHGIMLTNGIGTVDADYPEEICVLLTNTSHEPFSIEKGERIAQMALNFVGRFSNIDVGGKRQSGFGSTGRN